MIAVLGDREGGEQHGHAEALGSKRQTVLSGDEWIEQIHVEINERRLHLGFGEDQQSKSNGWSLA